jgi:hypothetical protein
LASAFAASLASFPNIRATLESAKNALDKKRAKMSARASAASAQNERESNRASTARASAKAAKMSARVLARALAALYIMGAIGALYIISQLDITEAQESERLEMVRWSSARYSTTTRKMDLPTQIFDNAHFRIADLIFGIFKMENCKTQFENSQIESPGIPLVSLTV